MHAITVCVPRTIWKIVQHSLSSPLLQTWPTTINVSSCTGSFGKFWKTELQWQHPGYLNNEQYIYHYWWAVQNIIPLCAVQVCLIGTIAWRCMTRPFRSLQEVIKCYPCKPRSCLTDLSLPVPGFIHTSLHYMYRLGGWDHGRLHNHSYLKFSTPCGLGITSFVDPNLPGKLEATISFAVFCLIARLWQRMAGVQTELAIVCRIKLNCP